MISLHALVVSVLLTLVSLPTVTSRDLTWTFSNVGEFSHWHDRILAPHMDDLVDLDQNNNVTFLVPTSDAVDRWMQTAEYKDLYEGNDEAKWNLILYHTLQGDWVLDDFDEEGLVLRSMLKEEGGGVSSGQRLMVQKLSEEDLGRGVSFFSGLGRESGIFFPNYEAEGTHLHAIDRVLTPPLRMADTARIAGLTSILGAANTINLDWWSEPDMTYFLPRNDAMRKVGSVLEDASDEDLQRILEYHFVNGTIEPLYSDQISQPKYATAGGENLKLYYAGEEGDGLFVNNAMVTRGNVLVKNGVISILDQVLNPNNEDSRDSAQRPFGVPAFEDAKPVAKAPFVDMVPSTKMTGGLVMEKGMEKMPEGALAEQEGV